MGEEIPAGKPLGTLKGRDDIATYRTRREASRERQGMEGEEK